MTAENKKEIEKLIENFRTLVKTHTGDVELIEIVGNKVKLKLLGACANCSLSNLSYDIILGGMIREIVPEVEIEIINISAKGGKNKKHAKFQRILKK